jgi:glycosyltransferase involved in cell wall biosynthesis
VAPVGTPPRVLFVAGCWYPDADAPMHGIFIRRHAEAAAVHHEVAVLHPVFSPPGTARAAEDWQHRGRLHELHLRWPGRWSAPGWRSQAAYLRAGIRGARAVRRSFGTPDLIHIQVVPSLGLVLGVMASFPGRPMLLTEHWSGYLPESGVRLGRLRRWYTGRLTRMARTVTTVSEAHRRALCDLGFAGRFQVLPNVVDTDRFRPAAQRAPGPFRLVHVSGLKAVKRAPDIVGAVCRLIGEGLSCELHVVGDGPDRQAAEARARGAGAAGRSVVFHGLQDEEGVAERLRRSDALVLFSAFENSPCVIAECLACGLPVIAPAVGGIPEHLTPERGVLVPPGDDAALGAAIRGLVSGERSFDRDRLRRYALRTFSREVVAAQLRELYAEAIARPGRSSRDTSDS